jgi:hypothetical protein
VSWPRTRLRATSRSPEGKTAGAAGAELIVLQIAAIPERAQAFVASLGKVVNNRSP